MREQAAINNSVMCLPKNVIIYGGLLSETENSLAVDDMK